MKYYIKINEKDYLLPQAVVSVNGELLNKYMIFVDDNNDGKKYFDLDKLVVEGKNKELLKICDQCIGSVGMLALSMDNEYLDIYNKLRLKLANYQEIIEESFKNGYYDKAYKRIYSSIEMILELFTNMMYEDEYQYKKKDKIK